MASLKLLFFFHALFVSMSFLSLSASIDGRKVAAEEESNHHKTIKVKVSSLFPSSVCDATTAKASKLGGATLKVVHKHGPCSKLNKDKEKAPNHSEILQQDQARVDKIRSQIAKKSGLNNLDQNDAANLPARSGASLGSGGSYLVTIGLGTPPKSLSLTFDTGSDLTWTQCEPCAGSCYPQEEPMFDPSKSTTYSNVSCNSTTCASLSSAGKLLPCSGSTCVYGIQYLDNSFSIGIFGKERLTLTSTEVFPDFYFGCGQNNQGRFGRTAGLLGLNRGKISVVSQTAQKYKMIFSYCLPPTRSSTGHLTFGGSPSPSAKFTPISTRSSSFYGIDFTAISVGGRELPISSTVFSTANAVIDSGTTLTYLPATAYSELRAAFRQLMSKYPMAKPLTMLDTCYDLSNYSTMSVPAIEFSFKGGAQVEIDASGIFIGPSQSQMCLAFTSYPDQPDLLIFGNTQQKTIEVVYDVPGGRLGFASGGCK